MLRSLNMWRLSIAAGRLAQPRFATKLTRNACPCALRAYSCAATARIPHAANVTRSWLLGRPQSRKLAPVAGPVLSARTLFIQTADTPNPHSKKFYPGHTVMEGGGTYVFRSADDTSASYLARNLFRVEGVDNLMFGEDFITVSKKEEYSWDEVNPEVFAVIMDFFASGAPVFKENVPKQSSVTDDDNEVVAMVKELLDTRIRPVIHEDGGDIEFVKMENGIVYVKLHGACGTCPSSTATLKGGIENMLMHYVPEVESVEQILEEKDIVSEDAFNKLERDLLRKHLSK